MSAPRVTSTVGGFRFERPYTGAIEWRVFDAATDVRLGTVRPNGSRLRSRAWTWSKPDGTEGRASSRGSAAEALAR